MKTNLLFLLLLCLSITKVMAQTNLALGKTISSFPVSTEYGRMTDGDLTSKSNVTPPVLPDLPYYILDLGIVTSFASADLVSGYTTDGTSTTDAIKGMKLQWSNTNNGTDWADITGAAITDNPATTFIAHLSFSAISTRFVRWVLTELSSSPGATLYKPAEIMLYAPVGSTVPDAPTSVSAVAGDAQATVSFTAPANNGGSAITGYIVTSSPGGFTQAGAASPIVVTGLTNGTAYTFTVVATNAIGNSVPSLASAPVTPAAAAGGVNVALGKTVTVSGTTYSGAPSYLTDGILLDETNTSRWRGDVPSTVDIDFGAVRTIVSADIYTGYFSTSWESMVAAFSLQSWDGSSWIDIPGASITGNVNEHVTFTFSSSVTTQKVRLVTPTGASDFARYMEIQAWTAPPIYPTASTWTGATNSDWFTVSNWANVPVGANVPPVSTTDVSIPVGATNYPTITAAAVCNTITIASGASLIDEGNYLSVTGTATVYRTITDAANDKWHLFISPVNESTQASAGSCFEGAYVDDYSETAGAWERLVTDDYVISGRGYALNYLAGSRDLVFTGTLKTSPVAFSNLSYTGSVSVDYIGWHLVGNPYPCGIDPALCSISGALNAFAYVLNTTSGNYEQLSIDSNTIPGTIAPLQGFFVRTSDALPNSLTLDNAAKVHGGTFFKRSNTASQMLALSIEGNNYSDKTYIRFNPEATANFDQAFDAYKRAGLDAAPQLYSIIPGEKAAVNTLPDYTSNPNVALGLKVGAETTYTINAAGIDNLDALVPVRLDDLKLGTSQDLRLNPVYSFTAAPGDDENRFILSFGSVTGLDKQNISGINVVSANGIIRVTHNAPATGTVYLYSVSGRLLAASKLNVGETSLRTASTGVFVVKVVTNKATYTQKMVVVQ
jgi:hypothetical protein